MTRRIEITLSQERWEQLESARGHEPRASFIKRALESALGDVVGHSTNPPGGASPAPTRAPADRLPPKTAEIKAYLASSGVKTAREVEKPIAYRCRTCGFSAKSPKARCPRHGGALEAAYTP